MDLVCDVLDKPLVDRNGREMGRVDGVVLELRAGEPPRVAAVCAGPSVLGDRLSPFCGRLAAAVERVLDIDEGRPLRLAFDSVTVTERHVRADITVGETGAANLERKLRAWIVWLTGTK